MTVGAAIGVISGALSTTTQRTIFRHTYDVVQQHSDGHDRAIVVLGDLILLGILEIVEQRAGLICRVGRYGARVLRHDSSYKTTRRVQRAPCTCKSERGFLRSEGAKL